MRSLIFGAVVAGCASRVARPQADPPRAAPDVCDVHAAAESTRRAWLGSEPVIVVDVDGTRIQIAVVSPDTIIERWVPITALGRAVITETAVSPRARSPGDPALRVLPGFPLATTSAPWTAVHATGTIAFDGFVPSDVRGMIWVEPPAFSGSTLQMSFEVHTAARPEAPVRAKIRPGTKVRAARGDAGHWIAVTASGSHAIVDGFVERPPPAPIEQESDSGEFSDMEIDGVGTEWIPIGTCLWDAPGGHVTGAIVASQLTRPLAEENGWSALSVHTPWGEVTYHAHAPVVEPPPPKTWEEWKFQGEWGGGLGR